MVAPLDELALLLALIKIVRAARGWVRQQSRAPVMVISGCCALAAPEMERWGSSVQGRVRVVLYKEGWPVARRSFDLTHAEHVV